MKHDLLKDDLECQMFLADVNSTFSMSFFAARRGQSIHVQSTSHLICGVLDYDNLWVGKNR